MNKAIKTDFRFNQGNNSVQAFWLALSSLSTILISIVSAAVLARYLDKTEYGTYKQVLYVYNSLLIVFSAGLPGIYSYYLPQYPVEQGYSIVKKISRLLFITGFLFALTLYFGAGFISNVLGNPSLESGLQIFAVIPILILPTLGIEGVFLTFNKSKLIPVYQFITRIVLFVCIIAPIIFLDSNVHFALYGWIIGSVFSFLMAYFFFKIPFKNIELLSSSLTKKEILAFSLPIMGASLAGIAISSSDQFFISRYFGTEEFAEFSNGFIQLPFVGMISGSAAAVIMPKLSSYFTDKKSQVSNILTLWNSTIIKSATVLYPMIILAFYFSDLIITTLFSDLYSESTAYFKIKLISNFFNIIVFAPFLLSSGNNKFYMNLHLAFAAIIWTSQYIIVSYFPDPYLVAVSSVTVTVLLIITAVFKMKDILGAENILSFIPILSFLRIIGHCLACLTTSFLLWNILPFDKSMVMIELILITSLYMLFIYGSARYVGIDYIGVFRPIIMKVKSLFKTINI